MMLGWMNCQSASPATASFPISCSVNSNTVASSNRWPLEMANLVRAERAAPRHFSKQIFEYFGKMRRIIDACFENFGDDVLRQQSCVFGKKAEDDSIEETRDAQIFALSD